MREKILTPHASLINGNWFQFHLTGSSFFQLLDFQFRFRQFFLADFHELRALFVFGEQGFERQIVSFHRFDDGFEVFQRCLKRRIFCGTALPRAFGMVRHG